MSQHSIPYGKQYIDEADIKAVVDILSSSYLTQGPTVDVFENAVAAYVGSKYAVAVSNGTAALHIAYLATGLKRGDKVITSPLTFVATANAAFYCEARAEFVDVDQSTLNICPDALSIKLESVTPHIIAPVHFAGAPCEMERISKLAKSCGAFVVEDAAHAFGGVYPSGEKIGSCKYSDMTIFSFHPVKPFTTAEGGVITTNSDELYRLLLKLRSHGINKLDDTFVHPDRATNKGETNSWYYEMQILGFNYRLTDIQAALGLSQLKKLPEFLEKRRRIAKFYDEELRYSKHITVLQEEMRNLSGMHLYPVWIDYSATGKSRSQVMRELREMGVLTQVHYIPVPTQPFYERLGYTADFPNANRFYEGALSLPLYYSLSSSEQRHVIASLKQVINEA